MGKQLTIRMSDDLDLELTIKAKRMRRKRSEVVRIALEEYLEVPAYVREGKTPYQHAKELGLIGAVDFGPGDIAENVDKYLEEQGFGVEDNFRK